MKTLDYVLIGFLVLLLAFGFFYLQYSKTEGAKCLEDPLSFAQDKLGDGSTCSCTQFSNSAFGVVNYCAKNCPN